MATTQSQARLAPLTATLIDAGAVSAPRTGQVLVAIICAPLIGFLNAIALVPFLPVVADDMGTSVAALGQVIAISMVVATGLGLVAGQFADRYGYRRVLVVGLSTVVLSAFGSALAPNFPLLLMAGLTGAVSRAVVAPVSLTIAGTWFDGEARERAIGLVSAAIAGAAVLGVPLMAAIAAVSNWRIAFIALGIAAGGVIVVTRQALPASQPPAASNLGLSALLATYRQLLRGRSTLSILAANLLRSTGVWAVGTYIATYLVTQQGLSVQQASLAFAAAGAGVFMGSLGAGTPLRAMSPRVLLVGCSALGTGLVGVTMALPMPPIGVFGLVFAGMVLSGMGNVAASLLLLDETTTSRATTMSLNGAILSLASAVGGIAGGLLLALGGYTAIGTSALVLGVLAAALASNSQRFTKRRGDYCG